MVARLLRSGDEQHASEAQEIALTATVAVEQPCA
jgi:hypothetical protein